MPYLGSSHVSDAASGVAVSEGPRRLELAVTPNPGIRSVAVSFALPQAILGAGARPVIVIYDASGRLVADLPIGAGPRGRVTWDGRSSSGAEVPPGIYFLRLDSGGKSVSAKVVMLR